MNATPDQYTKEQLREMEKAVGYWFHSIELGQGVVTNGLKTAEWLALETEALRLPDLRGKTVLDIGAFDGHYSFEAERRGAGRVVALDCLAWEVEIGCNPEYERQCRERGLTPHPFHDPRNTIWRESREELPGKRRFDLARRALGSKVESVFADFTTVDLNEIGTFDVVLFLGVLYHLESPFQALRRVAAVTNEVAIIETEAVVVPGFEHYALCEFYESDELNADPSNWWAPNEKALLGMCRAVGFRSVEVVQGPPSVPEITVGNTDTNSAGAQQPGTASKPGHVIPHYRLIVHAKK
ncbi:MAG TPA: DUF1698 domain-containing protein [Gemmataceae bacterium]|nr:DUF1698 domain-containing protein [Gemmataceae bacterium]